MSERLRSNAAPAGLWSCFSLLIAAALVGLLVGDPIRVRLVRASRAIAAFWDAARRRIMEAGAGLRRRKDGQAVSVPMVVPHGEPPVLTPRAQLGKLEQHVARAAERSRTAGRCHIEAAAKLDYVELAIGDIRSEMERIRVGGSARAVVRDGPFAAGCDVEEPVAA
ncbi:MAG: hypothetical protein GC150_16490 [Rhizobiales bacterium]|nr:hypothetical protein [Hyphomicrobiales bacterium]